MHKHKRSNGAIFNKIQKKLFMDKSTTLELIDFILEKY